MAHRGKRLKTLALCVLLTSASQAVAQKTEPRGVRLYPRPLEEVRDRLEELRARQLREAQEDSERRELDEVADLEKRYWKLWEQDPRSAQTDPGARPTPPSAASMRERMTLGRELYERYGQRAQRIEYGLKREGKEPEMKLLRVLRATQAQRDTYTWTIERAPRPGGSEWAQFGQRYEPELFHDGPLPPELKQRYGEILEELRAPLPLPAPERIERYTWDENDDPLEVAWTNVFRSKQLSKEHRANHNLDEWKARVRSPGELGKPLSKQAVLHSIQGLSRAEIQALFDAASNRHLWFRIASTMVVGGKPAEYYARAAIDTWTDTVRSYRFVLAVLAEELIVRREPREIQDDVDAILQRTQQWLMDTEALLK